MQERLAVVEEVDAAERRAGFVDHFLEQIEVEHARLARARDAGFRSADGLVAGNIAGGGALNIETRGNWRDVEIALRRLFVRLQRQLERAIAAEARAALVQISTQLRR